MGNGNSNQQGNGNSNNEESGDPNNEESQQGNNNNQNVIRLSYDEVGEVYDQQGNYYYPIYNDNGEEIIGYEDYIGSQVA